MAVIFPPSMWNCSVIIIYPPPHEKSIGKFAVDHQEMVVIFHLPITARRNSGLIEALWVAMGVSSYEKN